MTELLFLIFGLLMAEEGIRLWDGLLLSGGLNIVIVTAAISILFRRQWRE